MECVTWHIDSCLIVLCALYQVVFSWGEVLRSCAFDDLFEKKQRQRLRFVIVTLNILCFGYTLANIVLCATSKDLIAYFDSQDFVAYMLVTVVRNSIMGASLFVYGSHLFSRLSNYSSLGAATGAKTASSKTLLKACNKLILLVFVSNGAFALQLVAVILWLREDSGNTYYLQTPQHVHMSPYAYWLVLECLPKVVPSVTFYLTMGFLNQVWDRNRHHVSRKSSQRGENTVSSRSSSTQESNLSPKLYVDSSDDERSVISADSSNSINVLTSPLLKNGNAYYGNEEDEVFYNSMRSSLGDNLLASRDSLLIDSAV